MRLGIISDAHHTWDARGRLCVLAPVARQFEQWARLFDTVTVCAPLASGLPPPACSPYEADNIALIPVRVAGGNTIRAKVELALQVLPWWVAIRRLLERVDAVHIRCPNNISIPGLLALERSSCLRQAVYTGTWNGYAKEPRTYRWQREYLRDRFTGPVAVYGSWPGQPPHVVSSFSPSYRDVDWTGESARVAAKVQKLRGLYALPRPLALLTVGGLDENKNQQVAVRMVKELAAMNVDARLDIVGDGPWRERLVELVATLGLQERVRLRGSMSQSGVRSSYRDADFVIHPSRSEGFTKVPVEAMFHGAIPIMSDANLHPQFAGSGDDSRGRCFACDDVVAGAAHVRELASNPVEMARYISNGRDYARQFTLEMWQVHLRNMLETHWRVALRR